ncbi:MAG: hypothetical protein ACK4P2_06250 [Hyphomonas sp.]
MKFDFNIRPAAEMPAADALRPLQVNEVVSSPRLPALPGDTVSELSLLARRQSRIARRATR